MAIATSGMYIDQNTPDERFISELVGGRRGGVGHAGCSLVVIVVGIDVTEVSVVVSVVGIDVIEVSVVVNVYTSVYVIWELWELLSVYDRGSATRLSGTETAVGASFDIEVSVVLDIAVVGLVVA